MTPRAPVGAKKRNAEKFVVTKALTERFRKSAISSMQRLLNKNSKEKKEIDKVIDSNRDKATEYKSGKVKLFGFFVGQVMKVSGGKANPQLVNEILKKKL